MGRVRSQLIKAAYEFGIAVDSDQAVLESRRESNPLWECLLKPHVKILRVGVSPTKVRKVPQRSS
jgi:hypothetical protein